MGTQITYDKVESTAYSNMFDVVNNRSYISDPRHAGNTSNTIRTFVYDSDPFMKSLNFADMPYMILTFPTLESQSQSADAKYKLLRWKHTLIVRTARDGASNSTVNTGRTDMLNICDDIMQTFNSTAVKTILQGLNMTGIQIAKVSATTDVLDQKQVYESSYEIQYDYRLRVVA